MSLAELRPELNHWPASDLLELRNAVDARLGLAALPSATLVSTRDYERLISLIDAPDAEPNEALRKADARWQRNAAA